MLDPKAGKGLLLFFLLATVVNFGAILYFFNNGMLNPGEFLIAGMVWFYGTIIVFDHIEPEDDEGDDDGFEG